MQSVETSVIETYLKAESESEKKPLKITILKSFSNFIKTSSFYKLPYNDIKELIDKSDIVNDLNGPELLKTIFEKYSQREPYQAIKLLVDIDIPSIELEDAIELIGAMKCSSLLQKICEQYKQEIDEVTVDIPYHAQELAELRNQKPNQQEELDLSKYNDPLPPGPPPLKRPDNFEPEITLAAAHGKVDSIHYLVQTGTFINTTDKYGNTAIHRAVASNQVPAIKYLVENGASLEVKNSKGMTALLLAVSYKYYNITAYLLNNYANINAQDASGNTALHIAVKTKNLEIIKLLLEKGIDINIRNKDNKLAVDMAENSEIKEMINKKSERLAKIKESQ